MSNYVDPDMLPKRYEVFANGAELYGAYETLPLPAVVKASLSSSGDGVCICFTKEDIKEAAEKFIHLEGNILVEQYIKVVTNYGVHFGISHNKKVSIDIIGVNEQLTTEKGEFIGGIIRTSKIPQELIKAVKHLKKDILPRVRNKGWYGIGGFDVLVDEDGNPYFIDCNFRMTGMSAYHFLIANKILEKPIAAFSGQFVGTAEELKEKLYQYGSRHSSGKFLQLITISKHEDTWRFNGTISFITHEDLRERAKLILETGVTSQALSYLAF
jgi:carbamoylphosphate synthase large subunit